MGNRIGQAPPVMGVNNVAKPNEVVAFAVSWGSAEAVAGDRIAIAASTQNNLVKNAVATVTIFQPSGVHETQIGAAIKAQVLNGNLATSWLSHENLPNGNYYAKVTVMMGGKTYLGRTKDPLKLRKDGFGNARPNYNKLTGG